MIDLNTGIGVGEGCGYRGIAYDVTRSTELGTFRIIVYGAFDAYGLIGPEKNGVAILDVDRMRVLTDEICRIDSGYYGPSTRQTAIAVCLVQMTDANFKEYVNQHTRSRYQI